MEIELLEEITGILGGRPYGFSQVNSKYINEYNGNI